MSGVDPVNQGSVIAAGQALVPNYAEQALREQLMGVQQQQARTQALSAQTTASHEAREAGRVQAYQAAIAQFQENPTSAGYATLMAQFPEFSEGVRRAWQTQDEGQRRGDFQSMAGIHAAARGGHYDVATAQMRRRVEADRQAGHPDPLDEAILGDLESGDPQRQEHAVLALSETLSAIGGEEHFASVYGAINPAPVVIDDILTDRTTGRAIAQSPYPRLTPGPNGSFYEQPRVGNIPLIGGQPAPTGASTTGEAEGPTGGTASPPPAGPSAGRPSAAARPPRTDFNHAAAAGLGRSFGTVTSTVRTPEHNREVGGARNSNHLARNGARAIDIARRRGVSHAQIINGYREAGYTLDPDTRDEGDHSHIVIASGPGAGGGGAPVRVRSIQQAQALPPGTPYLRPDGVRMVR